MTEAMKDQQRQDIRLYVRCNPGCAEADIAAFCEAAFKVDLAAAMLAMARDGDLSVRMRGEEILYTAPEVETR